MSAYGSELLWFGVIRILGVKNGFGRPDFDMGICFDLALGNLLEGTSRTSSSRNQSCAIRGDMAAVNFGISEFTYTLFTYQYGLLRVSGVGAFAPPWVNQWGLMICIFGMRGYGAASCPICAMDG
jgi:hypothetical protein